MQKIYGKFGYNEVKEFGVTANYHVKAGMDVVEFCKYVEECIVSLYPDAKDVAGKRVLLILSTALQEECK